VALGDNAKVEHDQSSSSQRTAILPAFEYQHDKFAFQGSGIFSLSDKPHFVTASLNIQPVDHFYLGGSSTLKQNKGKIKVKSAELRLAHTTSDFGIHVAGSLEKCTKGEKEGDLTPRISYGVRYKYSDKTTVGSQGNVDTSFSGGSGPTLSVGSVHKVDEYLSVSAKTEFAFKSKDEKGNQKETGVRLTVGTTSQLNAKTSATVGVDFNVRQLFGSSGEADHSVGVEFKFKE